MKKRLRYMAQVNPLSRRFEQLDGDTYIPFLPMENAWPGERLDLSQNRPKSAVAMGYTRFESGDIVVPKITPTFEASRSTLISDLPDSVGAGSTEFHVVRPGSEIDPRFLLYIFHSHDFLKLGEAEMYGVAGQKRVPDDFIRNWIADLPPLDEQRRIADFLDAETNRIDKLTEATRNQQNLVLARQSVAFHQAVVEEGGPDLSNLDLRSTGDDWKILPLNRTLRQLTNGYVGPTREIFVDDGVPYIQSLHVKHGSIDFNRRPYFVTPEWAEERPRIRLGYEDLLIVQTGAIGEVAIVDEAFTGASCHALLIARTNHEILLPKYLWHAFRSHWGRRSLLREQTGALHPHLEAGNVRFMKIPIPPLAWQHRIVERSDAMSRDTQRVHRALMRRLSLQAERRQALITAAVTGEFDVTTASRSTSSGGVV
ncbi:restriction endonuclease subunit S [Streptomyces sp. NPDC050703]|uniref:restriction endonuclease subunit S n=1 Tax=Streptomyces sp. NPDC050703 TaxID=3157218 RepID=UPI00343F0976